MTTSSLAAMRAAFDDSQSKNRSQDTPQLQNDYYPFWNMKPGQRCVIRFLPDADKHNPRGFLVEKVTHTLTINGNKRTVPCLSMYDDDCPICKVSQQYYKAEDEVNGKKYWKKRQYLARCLIVEDPLSPNPETGELYQGKVCTISLGFQIYNIIKDAFADPDVLEAEPQSLTDGYDFVIKKTQQGEYATYSTGTKFQTKQRALSEVELETALESSVELKTLLPKHPTIEKIQAMLTADLNGGDIDDDSSTPAVQTKTKESSDRPSSVASVPTPTSVSADDSGGSDDVDAMIAAIRARRASKSAD